MREALRFKGWIIILGLGLAVACTKTHAPLLITASSKTAAPLSARGTFPYAFSGKILDGDSREPLTRFSVEIVGQDPAISHVLNGLGDADGFFHVSRNASTEEHSFATVPLIISAAGFEPLVQMVELGSDCLEEGCPGVAPTPFYLKPLPPPAEKQEALTSPRRLQEVITRKGLPQLFRELMHLGKWDRQTENTLARAKNSQVFPSVVVFLKPASDREVTAQQLSAILADVETGKLDKLPRQWSGVQSEIEEFASTHRDTASLLLSVNELLPYLSPVQKGIGGESAGNLGRLASRVLAAGETQAQLAARLVGTGGEADLAFGGLMPLLQQWMGHGLEERSPYRSVLTVALQDPGMMKLLQREPATKTDPGDQLVAALKPLLQGFVGADGDRLMADFNELIREAPLRRLQEFGSHPGDLVRFARLAPYLRTLQSALQGEQGEDLAQVLWPLLKRQNPALTLRNIIARVDAMENQKAERVLGSLFPAAREWAYTVVPAKQVLVAQLMAGICNEDFKEVRVLQDLKGSPAVLISAQARDLLKMSMLSNVERVVVLTK